MKKYKFTIMLLLTFVIAFPVITVKLAAQEQEKKQQEAEFKKQQEELEREIEKAEAETEEPKTEEPEDTQNTEIAGTESEPVTENTAGVTAPEDDMAEFSQAEREYFSDALFIGDSRTVGLSEYADLGGADVFASTGMNTFKLFDTQLDGKNFSAQTLEQLLGSKKYGKIYLMLGINEMGYPKESLLSKYTAIVEKIKEMQPDAVLFLEANLHVSQRKSSSDGIYNNANLDWLNGKIKELCDQKQTFYVDVNVLFDDAGGNLDAQYTSDDAHVLGKYYAQWADWLLTQAIVK